MYAQAVLGPPIEIFVAGVLSCLILMLDFFSSYPRVFIIFLFFIYFASSQNTEMLAEFVLASPILLLWLFSVVSSFQLVCFVLIVYWIPKPLVSLLSLVFRSVLFMKISPNVAITIDDVPYGSDTKTLLESIGAPDMKFSLFVISNYVNYENRALLINAIKAGHELCNHGKTNSTHALLSASELAHELDACETLLNDLYREAGVPRPLYKFYRPGGGLFTKSVLAVASSRELMVVLGSVYPQDPVISSSDWNALYLQNHIESGDIVILHDRRWTPRTLRSVMNWMRTKNLQSVTLSDYMNK